MPVIRPLHAGHVLRVEEDQRAQRRTSAEARLAGVSPRSSLRSTPLTACTRRPLPIANETSRPVTSTIGCEPEWAAVGLPGPVSWVSQHGDVVSACLPF